MSDDPMWVPSTELVESANITKFMRWVNRRHGNSLAQYPDLWRWSVKDIGLFWSAIWDYFDVDQGSSGPALAHAREEMPGAHWFPGRSLNYAEQLLARVPADDPVILHYDETLRERSISGTELAAEVVRLALAMRRAGLAEGDRVVACMPNCPEAMIAMLATASIGAIWSIVSPETGVDGVLARFSQLAPRLLFGVDGYRYKGVTVDRSEHLERLVDGLPTLESVVVLPIGLANPAKSLPAKAVTWTRFEKVDNSATADRTFKFARVPFDQPLWILFSSGTTGLPKAMVHSHGGILLEQLKGLSLHMDLRQGDRLFFYTITGWMIWNVVLGSMLTGAACVLYDGHPAEPAVDQLWRIAEKSRTTVFGGSPSYVKLLMQAQYQPAVKHDLSALRAVVLSGSPASPECMRWFHEAVKPDLWVQSACGGTDVCTSFVGGVPIVPVYAGEIQARWLGVDAVAMDDSGHVVEEDVGELVIRQPMPSMPVMFWGDSDNKRYLDTYFTNYAGQWQQGDFVRFSRRGGAHVLGRSDATLNRHGVRIGTAEIYRTLEEIPEVGDSIVMNIDLPKGEFWMPLLVRLAPGAVLDAALQGRISGHLKTKLSPRHVPDDIIAVPGIPYTKTGKRLEVPLRRILCGTPVEKAVAKESTEDFELLAAVIDIARARMPLVRAAAS